MATQNSTDTSKPLAATQGGLGTATYATGDTVYASASNTLSKLTIGSTGHICTQASGVPSWAAKVSGTATTGCQLIYDSSSVLQARDPRKYLYYFDDMLYVTTFTPTAWVWQSNWTAGDGGTVASEDGHPGILYSQTSTGTTDTSDCASASIYVTGDLIRYETLVRMPTLATVAQDYRARFGLVSAMASPVSGVYFEYDRGNSVNWRGCCTESSTTTRTSGTNVSVDANTWQKLTFVMNAAGSSCEFFVGSTSIGTVTANIPNTAVTMRHGIQKIAGTTARSVQTDYVKMFIQFGSNRYT